MKISEINTIILAKNYLSRKNSPLRQSLFTNAGYLIGVEVLNAFIGFIYWGIAARLYRPEDIGFASAILSTVSLIAMIAGLGTGNGLIRFLPESKHPIRMLNSLFIFNILVALFVGVLFLVTLPSFFPSLSFFNKNNLVLIWFLTYGIVATFGGSLRMTFLALRQAKFVFLQSISTNGIRLVFVAILASFGVLGLISSVSIAILIAIILSYFIFLPRAISAYSPRFALSKFDLLLLLPYSFGTYIASLLMQTPTLLLPILVLELIGPASAGHAQIAWLIGGMLVTPGLALSTSAFIEASNAPDNSFSIYSKALVTGLLITILASALIFLIAPLFLLLFGSSYSSEGALLLRWLAAAAPFVVLVKFYFSKLLVQKRIGRLIFLSFVLVAITLVIAIKSISKFGITSFGTGWFIGNLLIALIAVREGFQGIALGDIKRQFQL